MATPELREARERLLGLLKERGVDLRERGAVRTRGSLKGPSPPPVQPRDLSPALNALREASWEARREVALALAEWGDQTALEVLEELSRRDPEWRVREVVAEALARIGGPRAVDALKDTVKTDPHPRPVEAALKGLGELALATWPDRLAPAAPKPGAALRTRGAVRVRGASPSQHISPEADAILTLLDDVRFRHPDPSVRVAADDTLSRLDE